MVDEDWPLIIEDNYCRKHHVLLNPGEVIFYESAPAYPRSSTPIKRQQVCQHLLSLYACEHGKKD